MLGWHPACRGRVHGIASADGLVIRDRTEVGFARDQRAKIQVADDGEALWVGAPAIAVASMRIAVANNLLNVSDGQLGAGDPPGDEDAVAVDRYLYTHERPRLLMGRLLNQQVCDCVADLVGVASRYSFCRTKPRTVGQVHAATSRTSSRPVTRARSSGLLALV